jgi:hypothetical protein
VDTLLAGTTERAQAISDEADASVRSATQDSRAAAEIARYELQARLFREAGDRISEQSVDLATRAALGAAVDLAINAPLQQLNLTEGNP